MRAASRRLMAAAASGDRNAELVKLLLGHGAAVNAKTGDTTEIVKNGAIALEHLTALQLAAGQANYDAVEALVKAGADVNARDVRAANALVFAVATDHANPKIVKLLLARGAERNSALDWARRYQDPAILPLFGFAPSAKTAGSLPAAQSSPHVRERVMKALAGALWALHESGMPASDSVYCRGVDYLLRTQHQDGTWHVLTRALGFQPYFQSGFPYDHDQWISQAGTAMATIALTFAAQ